MHASQKREESWILEREHAELVGKLSELLRREWLVKLHGIGTPRHTRD
jgi:hypothetical protein